MVERIVCASGCVHPSYECTLSDGTKFYAKPRLALRHDGTDRAPSDERMQQLAGEIFAYARKNPEEVRRQTREIVRICFG